MGSKVDSKKAEAVMKRAGLKPLEPYSNSKKPWKCKHLKCGRIVSPTYNAIQRGQGGCIFCAGLAVEPKEAGPLIEDAVPFIVKLLFPILNFPEVKVNVPETEDAAESETPALLFIVKLFTVAGKPVPVA